MSDMDRREFLSGVLGSAALLGAGNLPQIARTVAGLGSNEATSAAVVSFRQNVYCLRPTSPDIVAYRNAIAVMKAKPATDPISWLAQANIHGSFAPQPGMITGVCEHSGPAFVNRFFVSWHRVYLYYFERIVRAASGNPKFAIPYWGYTPVGQGPRDLPEMFRDPTNLPELYTAERNADLNTGNSLLATVVDPGAALVPLTFDGASGFSRSLEGTPHNLVHNAVGSGPTTTGPLDGWMREFETAAQDPIFWLHHANIDRLWGIWLGGGGGRANPTDAGWLNHSWNFYDEAGAQVSMTGTQILDTAAQLGYRYAPTNCFRLPDTFPFTRLRWLEPRLMELLNYLRTRRPWPGPAPAPLAQQAGIRLGSTPVEIRLPISAEGQRILQRFPTSSGEGTQMALVFSDIRLHPPSSVFYEVYINLEGDPRAAEYTNRSYAGNISFFGPAAKGRNEDLGLASTINLIPVFARLSLAGQWSNSLVGVTLIPRAFTENRRPEQLLGDRVQATIGRAELRIE